MNPYQNHKIWVCPHCGSENIQTAEAWMSLMNDSASGRCSNCKKIINFKHFSVSLGSKKKESRHFNLNFIIIFVLLLLLMIYLNRTFDILSFKKDSGQIIYEVLIILFISSSLAFGKIWQKFKYLTIWAGIFFILVIGYSYRFELAGVKDKVLAEFVPAKGFQKKTDAISFPISSDGHFYIRAEVNDIPIMFLVDTGASHIVLSPSDAGKLGIKVNELRFDRFYETANGNGRGASIKIADLRIGGIHLKKIGASVNEAEMRNSLIGMTFFKRLKSYEVKNDVLTLYGVGQ